MAKSAKAGKSGEIDCPACDAVIMLNGDELEGEQVYCSYCSAPYVIKFANDEGDYEVEEDY